MRKTLLLTAFAAMIATPTVASAQAIPSAVVAIVDLEKVTSQCTACRTAQTALQSQVNALKQRQDTLAAPLKTEGEQIQAAIDALKGKEPDTALQNRVRAFQAKQQQGAQELARQQQQIQRNQAHISQQIQSKLGPIYQQVMQRRRANVLVEIGSTLASGAGLDVTNDVLTALNSALPTVQTVAPAQPAQQQPQGR
jgi:Skp family chaperone for outer membrane proteins